MYPSTWYHLSLFVFLSVVRVKALDCCYSVLQMVQTRLRQVAERMACWHWATRTQYLISVLEIRTYSQNWYCLCSSHCLPSCCPDTLDCNSGQVPDTTTFLSFLLSFVVPLQFAEDRNWWLCHSPGVCQVWICRTLKARGSVSFLDEKAVLVIKPGTRQSALITTHFLG